MKALWIALVWPEPASSAAGFRTSQLINALRDAGHEVEVCSPCRQNEHREALEKNGIKTASFLPNDSAFDSYLLDLKPEVVFFDRFMAEEQFGWRVREHCPNAARILDTIDLHSVRRARQKKLKGSNTVELSQKDLLSEDSLRELSSIYRSDLSLIISDYELDLLVSKYQVLREQLNLCRFEYAAASSILDFESRKDFVAIGNFNHPPNVDSFRLLREVIWPKIRNRMRESGQEGVELHIYGAYPTKEMMSADDKKSGFRVKGWAKDSVETLSRYRINLAPLRFGAGIKGKISDGWAAGTPCIGTSIAAEGMHQSLEFGGVVQNEWDAFSENAASLYREKPLWDQAQSKGLKIIAELYSKEKNSDQFLSTIQFLVENLPASRENNFLGALLWQNQNRSIEYFSRWIEVKNELAEMKTENEKTNSFEGADILSKAG